jgi:hypothetical protein
MLGAPFASSARKSASLPARVSGGCGPPPSWNGQSPRGLATETNE